MTVSRPAALAILTVMPLFFSSNIIFGRAAVDEVGPFTLAFLRWFGTAFVLAVIGRAALRAHWPALRALDRRWLAMGFFGMWVCGALVYWALAHTTATNGTLIYTTSPVLIIALEAILRGRRVALRELVGIAIAIAGVIVIIARGTVQTLLALDFNAGDLVFVATAISWAAYSVMLKAAAVQAVPTVASFCALSFAGALTLAPFAAFEIVALNGWPASVVAWGQVGGIVLFASLLAFSAYQIGVRVLDPTLAGVFLYLLPVYGVAMAVLFLGETFERFHAVGIVTVLAGVVLATFPAPKGLAHRRSRGKARLSARSS